MRNRVIISMFAACVAACSVSLPAFGQAGENATLPLPPNPPPPGKGIPDFNGVWVLPYTPDLSRPLKAPIPLTDFGAETFKNHLGGDDPHPLVHQVHELPVIKPHVIEYRCHRLRCPHCGTTRVP